MLFCRRDPLLFLLASALPSLLCSCKLDFDRFSAVGSDAGERGHVDAAPPDAQPVDTGARTQLPDAQLPDAARDGALPGHDAAVFAAVDGGISCDTNQQCAGGTCVQHLCKPAAECDASKPCVQGKQCSAGKCAPIVAPPPPGGFGVISGGGVTGTALYTASLAIGLPTPMGVSSTGQYVMRLGPVTEAP